MYVCHNFVLFHPEIAVRSMRVRICKEGADRDGRRAEENRRKKFPDVVDDDRTTIDYKRSCVCVPKHAGCAGSEHKRNASVHKTPPTTHKRIYLQHLSMTIQLCCDGITVQYFRCHCRVELRKIGQLKIASPPTDTRKKKIILRVRRKHRRFVHPTRKLVQDQSREGHFLLAN